MLPHWVLHQNVCHIMTHSRNIFSMLHLVMPLWLCVSIMVASHDTPNLAWQCLVPYHSWHGTQSRTACNSDFHGLDCPLTLPLFTWYTIIFVILQNTRGSLAHILHTYRSKDANTDITQCSQTNHKQAHGAHMHCAWQSRISRDSLTHVHSYCHWVHDSQKRLWHPLGSDKLSNSGRGLLSMADTLLTLLTKMILTTVWL